MKNLNDFFMILLSSFLLVHAILEKEERMIQGGIKNGIHFNNERAYETI